MLSLVEHEKKFYNPRASTKNVLLNQINGKNEKYQNSKNIFVS